MSGGLGTPGARLVFVFVWVCGLVLGVIDHQFSPFDPVNALAFLCALLATLLLTTPGEHPLSRLRAILLPTLSCFIAVVALARSPEVANVSALTFAVYLVAFMIPRGNAVAGAVGSTLVVGYALAWGLARDATGMQLAQLLGVPLGSVIAGIVWRLVLQQIIRSERRYHQAEFRARDQEAAARAALEASREELRSIRHEVAPLLERIAAGHEIDEHERAELRAVEAAVRDRLRAPRLQRPELVRAVGELRARGATVVMLGESLADDGVIGPALAASLAATINDIAEGRVTIRTHPIGRDAAVTVVLSSPGRTEQLAFAANGELLARG